MILGDKSRLPRTVPAVTVESNPKAERATCVKDSFMIIKISARSKDECDVEL